MKIAISAKSSVPEQQMDSRFGRCPYFFIFDTEKGSYEVIKNTAADSPGGAGSAAAKLINKYGVSAVVSGNYGPHAVSALKAFEIKMYISTEDTIWMVVDKYKHGVLTEADKATVSGKH